MREYCLVTQSGLVINMCMNYRPEPPALSEYAAERGHTWVPVEKVPQDALQKYRYWSERP